MDEKISPPFPTGKAKLYWLINLYLSDKCDVRTFCCEFEQTYNFEVEKTELSDVEKFVFNDIFSNVTVYCDVEGELKAISFYRSAGQIRECVEAGRAKLRTVRWAAG